MYGKDFDELIEKLRTFPGIGKKQSEKIAFYIINLEKAKILELFSTIDSLQKNLQKCEYCKNISLNKVCDICLNTERNSKLMIVESVADLNKFENLEFFDGKYYIIEKEIISSFLKDKSKKDIFEKLKNYASQFPEVILAISPTLEGEIVSNYLKDLIGSEKTKVSQLAHGIPLGAQVEYIDSFTLKQALINRTKLK